MFFLSWGGGGGIETISCDFVFPRKKKYFPAQIETIIISVNIKYFSLFLQSDYHHGENMCCYWVLEQYIQAW